MGKDEDSGVFIKDVLESKDGRSGCKDPHHTRNFSNVNIKKLLRQRGGRYSNSTKVKHQHDLPVISIKNFEIMLCPLNISM